MSISKIVELQLKKYLEDLKNNPAGHLILLAIVLCVSYWIFVSSFGPEQPGVFLERTSYQRTIYVLVFTGENDTKNYLLPGDITRGESGYTINSVTWPNGGYSTFGDCEISLNKKSSCLILNSKENETFMYNMKRDPNYVKNNVQELMNLPEYYIQLTNNPV